LRATFLSYLENANTKKIMAGYVKSGILNEYESIYLALLM